MGAACAAPAQIYCQSASKYSSIFEESIANAGTSTSNSSGFSPAIRVLAAL